MLQRHRLRAPSLLLSLTCVASFSALTGCGDEVAEVAAEQQPLVGLLELPISHRNADSEPIGAKRLEVGPTGIRVDDEDTLSLDNGKVPPGEHNGNIIGKLSSKLSGAGAIAIKLHGATPYATLARIVYTATQAGAKQIFFEVRKPSATTETGWMKLGSVQFTEKAEPPVFEDADMLNWEDFTGVWREARAGCKEDARGDCGWESSAKATGGKLDMLLRVRGTAITARFRQYIPVIAEGDEAAAAMAKAQAEAAAAEKKKKAPQMLDGIAAPESEEVPEDPATAAMFTFRNDQATRPDGAFVSALKPVCGSVRCAAIAQAEGITLSARFVAMLGAAFPDGSPDPRLAWTLPK